MADDPDDDLESTVERLRDRVDDLESQLDQESRSPATATRRDALKAGGAGALLGALGLGSITSGASADPQGRLGSASDPVQQAYINEADVTALSADGAAINRSTATISNGTLPYNNESWIAVAGESSPDDLDYIEPSTINGQLLILNGTADSINVRHNQGGSGEIFLAGATNKTIQYAADSLVLQYRNSISAWAEIAYADAT